MIRISAIVIAKNSEELIEDCLKSISFCDEIVVVDGGSIDKTVSIVKKMPKTKLVEGKSNDFAEQRNIGLKHAKGEWVLYVDTDERVSSSLREEIIQHTTNPIIQYDAFRIKRKNYYLGNHEWPTVEKIERVFKKDILIKWKGQLHESPERNGEVGELEGYLFHYTHRNLSLMLDKTNEWSEIEAKLRFDTNHPKMVWWRFFRVLWTGFYDSYIMQSGWRAGTAGLIESIYQGFSLFITYAKLWELQERTKNKFNK